MKYIIIVQWYTANGLYPHEAYIEQIRFVGSEDNGILACHGYNFEEFPDAFDRQPFTDRANSLGNRLIVSLCGRLAKILPNTKVRVKLMRARSNFSCYLIIQMSV